MKTSRSKHYNSSRSSLPFEDGMTNVKFHNVIDDSPETAVLVGIITPSQDERKTKEYLDELEFLAETAGAKTIRRFTQRLGGPNSVTYLPSERCRWSSSTTNSPPSSYVTSRTS